MENRLKLTIFTPTYNRGKFLYRLFDSIMKQNSKDIEWLIVDDGSVDNTKKIVAQNFLFDIFISITLVNGKLLIMAF